MKGTLAVLAAALVLAACQATILPPTQRTGEWSVAESLERPRAFATALELSSGKILVFGGFDPADPNVTNPTSELIDPATGKVTTLPGRQPGRVHQTSTVAWRGRVVSAGGVAWIGGRFNSVARVDVFIPREDRWVAAAPLLQARSDHGAAALPSGEVLVTGGNYNSLPLSSSEIYDPVADAWREAAPLPHPRARFSMAALPNGRVLVAGGLDGKGRPLATSEIYDPATDKWTRGPDLSAPRVQHATVTLANGDVLLIGGQYGASGTADRYDQRTGTFEYAGSLVTPRLVEQAGVLPDGRVLITGGTVEKPGRTEWVPFASAEVWDPGSNRWSAFASPTMPRALGQLVSTAFGLFLISGIGDDQAAHRTVEKLTLK